MIKIIESMRAFEEYEQILDGWTHPERLRVENETLLIKAGTKEVAYQLILKALYSKLFNALEASDFRGVIFQNRIGLTCVREKAATEDEKALYPDGMYRARWRGAFIPLPEEGELVHVPEAKEVAKPGEYFPDIPSSTPDPAEEPWNSLERASAVKNAALHGSLCKELGAAALGISPDKEPLSYRARQRRFLESTDPNSPLFVKPNHHDPSPADIARGKELADRRYGHVFGDSLKVCPDPVAVSVEYAKVPDELKDSDSVFKTVIKESLKEDGKL